MFSEEDDLANVLRVVGERAVEGLYHRMRLLADGYGALHIFGTERVQRGKQVDPGLLPPAHHFFSGGVCRDFKFLVAKSVPLFSVAGEEVCKTGARVTREVPDQGGDRIRFRIDGDEEIRVFELSQGALSHALMAAELPLDFFEVVRCQVSHRDSCRCPPLIMHSIELELAGDLCRS